MFNNPELFTVGENGFSLPLSGGSIGVVGGIIEYTDETVKTIVEIPENAVPVMLMVSVTEDFDAGTNNDLEIGITSDPDYFATLLAVGTAGNFLPNATNMVAGRYGVKLGVGESLVATYIPTGTAAANGIANILLFYYLAGDTVELV